MFFGRKPNVPRSSACLPGVTGHPKSNYSIRQTIKVNTRLLPESFALLVAMSMKIVGSLG